MITCVMVLTSDICPVILLQSQVKSRAIALDLIFDWRRNYSSNDLSNDNLALLRSIIITGQMYNLHIITLHKHLVFLIYVVMIFSGMYATGLKEWR